MLEYFELMHQQVRIAPAGWGRHLWIYDRPSAPYLNEEFLAKAAELFRQADALAENDAVRARVRKARLGIDYVRLTRAKRFSVDGEWYRPSDLDGLKERWNAFVAGLRQFGITNFSESSPLTRDDEDFAEFMRPYRVATLEKQPAARARGAGTRRTDHPHHRQAQRQEPAVGAGTRRQAVPEPGGLDGGALLRLRGAHAVARAVGTRAGRNGNRGLALGRLRERPQDAA